MLNHLVRTGERCRDDGIGSGDYHVSHEGGGNSAINDCTPDATSNHYTTGSVGNSFGGGVKNLLWCIPRNVRCWLGPASQVR
jgi:hypothetical protein